MDKKNHSTGYTNSYTYSFGISESSGVSHGGANLRSRARAAVIVKEITTLLQKLAADVPTRDFVWARLSIDSCIDDILFGHLEE